MRQPPTEKAGRCAKRARLSGPLHVAGRVPLAGFYFLYYATVGITLPFLPAYFKSLGLSGLEVGLLLATSPSLSLLSPPLFGHFADRTGRADLALRVAAFGALLGFVPVRLSTSAGALLPSMALYAFFASAIVPLVDSLTLIRVAATGESYARIRLWGSVGFVLSSVLFGFAVSAIDQRAVIAPLALIAMLALWSLAVHVRAEPAPLAHPLSGLRLLRDQALTLALIACALHWIASAPFHGTFSIHVAALGLAPWVVGLSSGLGVVAEVVVMALSPKLTPPLSSRALMAIAFGASAIRWAGMAIATSAWAIVALSLIHGLTFGAFYVGAVSFVSSRVPAALRASGQGLFAAITFGVGGLVGYLCAGTGYDLLGGHWLFGAGAVLELVALGVLLLLNAAVGRASRPA